MTRTIVVAAALVLALLGCQGQEPTMTEWDLRSTPSIDAVGWPDGAGSAFETRDVDRILLPGDIVVDGMIRASAARDGGLGSPYEDVLRMVHVAFPRESPADVLARARDLADRLDLDLRELPAWAQRNADGVDTSPGGAQALSGRATLGNGAIVTLTARAWASGEATLDMSIYWERDEAS